ncbi:MAG: OPT/YSL family transporter [Elusimicrobia bacterium]|nr:OPT/YSL family transporter [Elusimicrobiota bacterium]MDE2236771.1 OPT/YSL family transporter [Elusimicrobiota bacterium]MDE2425239.1 OPT/YSL family transporter [Elusimicrobiota bacterium]
MTSPVADAPTTLGDPAAPPKGREFTLRAVVAGLCVAAVIGASYPYVVMKLGFGPNISVVSAFFGYIALGLIFRDYNRWENNIVQTAGTAAGQTAFLCVLMAAFDLLRADPTLHFTVALTPLTSFLWLTTAGILGVFLAVPMRRHFVVEEKLTYADGIAAAETLVVLDSRGPEARAGALSMGAGTVLSAVLMTLREDARIVADAWYRIPEMLPLGAHGEAMAFGVGWSLLSLGSGMLVGLRINFSMLLGTLVSWYFAPDLLLNHGLIGALSRKDVLLWVMWPATGIMVAGGLTALLLRWKTMARTFRNLSSDSLDPGDFPTSWVAAGSLVSAAALIIVQKVCLGTPVWMTLAAILLSVPLMLVSLRVLGETNWGPVSVMSNMMQAIFGLLAPGQIAANMVASGVTGSVSAESEGLMQDFKTGDMIGSTPRYLTITQLLAVPVGAAAVSCVYPLLRDTYGIGGERGLQSPISQKWAGFAQLLSKGLGALPRGAEAALVIAVVLGVLFTLLEGTRWRRWVPSPTGIGIGMLVPACAVITMFLGSVVEIVWGKLHKKSHQRHLVPLASGFIAGEAIVAVVAPILVALGLLSLKP